MSAVDLLSGGGLFCAGLGVGLKIGITLRGGTPQPPKAVCDSCDHGIGYHEDKKGQCQIWFGKNRICACASYNGPIPHTEYFAPEIAE